MCDDNGWGQSFDADTAPLQMQLNVCTVMILVACVKSVSVFVSQWF